MLYFFRVAALLVLIGSGSAVAGSALQLSMWSGLYAEVYAQRVLNPFSWQSGIEVEQHTMGSAATGIDVVELGLHEAQNSCDQGDLMYLPASLLSELSSAIDDFVPNALQPCAVGQLVWSTVVAFSHDQINERDNPPVRIDDFFNTDVYPGARILKKSPRALVEWALASSGVPPDRVYEVLSDTNSAWELIEKQLRRIEGDVVWVDSDEEAIQRLHEGVDAFAVVSSSSVMKEVLSDRAPGVIWDSALFEMSLLAIPATTEKPDLSSEFIQHIVSQGNLMAVSADLGLGTARYSTAGLLNSAYSDFLPSSRANHASSIWLNSVWWGSEAASRTISRFLDWVDRVNSQHTLVLVDSINLTAKAD